MAFRPTVDPNINKRVAELEKQLKDGAKIQSEQEKILSKEELRRTNIRKDLDLGKDLGQELIGTGSLGRLEEGQFAQERSADVKDIIERRRAALDGMSAQEQRVRRDEAGQEINRNVETQRRRLQAIQASQGLRGATAAAQQTQVLLGGIQQRGAFERALFLENEAAKRQALNSFETSVIGAEQREAENLAANLELQRFNLQQAAQERFGQISTALGFSDLVQKDRAAEMAAEAQRAAAAASSGCFEPNTMVRLLNGSYAPISSVKIGDQMFEGGVVYSLFVTQAPENDMYKYEGTIVAGSHAVLEDRKWIRVRESERAQKIDYSGLLYNLGTENHMICTKQTLFSDIDEVDKDDAIQDAYLRGLNEERNR